MCLCGMGQRSGTPPRSVGASKSIVIMSMPPTSSVMLIARGGRRAPQSPSSALVSPEAKREVPARLRTRPLDVIEHWSLWIIAPSPPRGGGPKVGVRKRGEADEAFTTVSVSTSSTYHCARSWPKADRGSGVAGYVSGARHDR